MKKELLLIVLSIMCISLTNAQNSKTDLNKFAQNYFNAWNKTQMPNATKQDLENYLIFLNKDVAYQHIPYNITDERNPDGKEVLRKGMTKWLGSSKGYSATLQKIIVGYKVIIIKYIAKIKSHNPKTGKTKEIIRDNVEVLELDNNKVSIIRKYGKY